MRPIVFAIIILLALAACGAGSAAPDGGRLFAIQCGGCHAATAAGGAALGPSLGTLRDRAQANVNPAAWLRAAITSPDAEVAPGYRAGLMPAGYGRSLDQAELDALVAYILRAGT